MRIRDWSSDVCSSDLQTPFDARLGSWPTTGASAGGEVSAFHAGGPDAATVGGAVAPGDGYRSVSTGGRWPRERTPEHPGPSELCCRRDVVIGVVDGEVRLAAVLAPVVDEDRELGPSDLHGRRSEEHRVGKEGVRTCRTRGSP